MKSLKATKVFCVFDNKGNCIPYTSSYYRKFAINAFIDGTEWSWKEWQKAGWRVAKVDIVPL